MSAGRRERQPLEPLRSATDEEGQAVTHGAADELASRLSSGTSWPRRTGQPRLL